MPSEDANGAEDSYEPCCGISTVPYEVLDRILSFIEMDKLVFLGMRGSRTTPLLEEWNVPQVMVLLHVSRQFRAATLQSQFWLDFGFDVRRLVDAPNWKIDQYRVESEHPVNQLLPVLFNDDNLVRRFTTKTEWAFPPKCPEFVQGIIQRIPSFPQTAQKLWLSGDSTYHLILNRPPEGFPNVRELGVLHTIGKHLPRIAEACPNVEHLFLALFLWTRVVESSLESLHNLQTFEIKIEYLPERVLVERLCGDLLPRASASTLTTLKIYGLGSDIAPDFSLTPFVRLQHLTFTDGFKSGFDRVLASISSKLISFDLQIHSNNIWRQSISFAHPCLSNLETLTVEVIRKVRCLGYGYAHLERCGALMDDITRTLTTVQTFTMDSAILRVPSYPFLVRLRQLKALTLIREADMPLVPDQEVPLVPDQEVLLKLFDDWPLRPRITVLTKGELGEEGSWKRKASWPLDSAYYSQLAGPRWPSHISELDF
jgi:hypothetical protein